MALFLQARMTHDTRYAIQDNATRRRGGRRRNYKRNVTEIQTNSRGSTNRMRPNMRRHADRPQEPRGLAVSESQCRGGSRPELSKQHLRGWSQLLYLSAFNTKLKICIYLYSSLSPTVGMTIDLDSSSSRHRRCLLEHVECVFLIIVEAAA